MNATYDRLTCLPNVLVLYVAGMLPSRDLLMMRRTCRNTYALFYGLAHQFVPVVIKHLCPGLLRQIHWQTSGKIKHMALSLSWPLSPEEMASLAELQLFQGINRLDVAFVRNTHFSYPPNERQHAINQTCAYTRKFMNIDLQNLVFGTCETDDGFEMFGELVLANQHTLQRTPIPKRVD
jgi:hypothetical protein